MATAQTFAFRYGLFRPLLSVLAAGPRFSSVELEDDWLRVRMGPSFHADIPRSSIKGARRHSGLVGGIGVHGWRGQWLVNGGIRGVVAVDIDPPAKAKVLGFPVRLRTLWVSLKEPEAFIAAVGHDRSGDRETGGRP